ncbi:sulfite exporter TauE/SafE family protein [Archaeoglobus neptunius]|uniref:sulfite exporter TauE/SafE family protein n=1 Tax=Archaeoglobus neptunius TaxID=2798580 RepID=UPI0019267450|nr:sulfite exporter TauE/SafE family protein [Archaeoglobus neptunius]
MGAELWIFLFSLIIGIVAPLSGVGGGVMFVPLLTAFSGINVDYVRGGGVMVALTSAMASSPTSIKRGFTNLRMVLPLILVSNLTAFVGGYLGLYISREFPEGKYYITLLLGVLLALILLIMALTERVEFPEPGEKDRICRAFSMWGECFEPSLGKQISYSASNTSLALVMFAFVGLIAGMFGLGAGWANVPVLNLVMLLPIRVAVATSMLIILLNTSIAAWVYMSKGAIIPEIAVPAMLGMTLGSKIGTELTLRVSPGLIRTSVMFILFVASATNIYKGVAGLMG